MAPHNSKSFYVYTDDNGNEYAFLQATDIAQALGNERAKVGTRRMPQGLKPRKTGMRMAVGGPSVAGSEKYSYARHTQGQRGFVGAPAVGTDITDNLGTWRIVGRTDEKKQ
jgi:hypothetical protein